MLFTQSSAPLLKRLCIAALSLTTLVAGSVASFGYPPSGITPTTVTTPSGSVHSGVYPIGSAAMGISPSGTVAGWNIYPTGSATPPPHNGLIEFGFCGTTLTGEYVYWDSSNYAVTRGIAVNNSSEVALNANGYNPSDWSLQLGNTKAYYWNSGSTPVSISFISTVPNPDDNFASGIDSLGRVCGTTRTYGIDPVPPKGGIYRHVTDRGWLYGGRTLTDSLGQKELLPYQTNPNPDKRNTTADAVNKVDETVDGQTVPVSYVVGTSEVNSPFLTASGGGAVYIKHAAVWKVSTSSPSQVAPYADLGTLGGNYSEAFGISASGMIVGVSDISTSTSTNAKRAVFWSSATSTIYQLPFPIGYDYDSDDSNDPVLSGDCVASAINDNKTIIGYMPGTGSTTWVVWKYDSLSSTWSGRPIVLTTGWYLDSVGAINNSDVAAATVHDGSGNSYAATLQF